MILCVMGVVMLCQFALKACGRLCADVNALNEKLAFIDTILQGCPVVVEVSFERMIALCEVTELVLRFADVSSYRKQSS